MSILNAAFYTQHSFFSLAVSCGVAVYPVAITMASSQVLLLAVFPSPEEQKSYFSIPVMIVKQGCIHYISVVIHGVVQFVPSGH